jgi:signal transduction histidine kinase
VFLVSLVLGLVTAFDARMLDRVLVALILPVMMSAFLIRPRSSYVYAVIVSLAYSATIASSFLSGTWGDDRLTQVYNYPSILSFFLIALIAWLVSSSLDRALADARQRSEELRLLNEGLDQRVRERTRELAKALEREHAAAVRNQTILESIGDGVMVADGSHHIILSNPAADRLAQRTLDNTPLHDALTGVQPEVLARVEEYMADGLGEERPNLQFEWNERTVAVNIAPVSLYVPGHEAAADGNVMVLRDVTREAELSRMKTIFLGSVSHELRTPMAAIKGYVDLLVDLEAQALSDAGRKYLEIISSNIKRLLTLANDLIDMSRLEVGEVALYPEWTRMEPIIESAADTVRREFEQRGLSLAIHLDANLPAMCVDRHRITQVLLNLLTNAYKYTVQGGATVKASYADHTLQIKVSDSGVGMTEEEQAHLFERFFRSNNEVVQREGGSGLGLTIAQRLVELHGGVIAFNSRPGVGTTFVVSLPVEEA